ncbi:MAG: HD domain-containing protein [Promethearchaeota archaeon]
MKDFLELLEGINYAFVHYRGLKRISLDLPYVIHPIRVTMILRAAGYDDFENKDLFLAALFHDLLEDTNISYEDLKKVYGDHVASIVMELTKPKDYNKEEWLRSFNLASNEAKIIKMADRIDNLLDMNLTSWTKEKQRKYAEQGLIILKNCKETNKGLATKLKELIDRILESL